MEKEQEGVEKDLSQLDGIAKGVVKTRNNDRKKKVMVTWQQLSLLLFLPPIFLLADSIGASFEQPDHGKRKGKQGQ